MQLHDPGRRRILRQKALGIAHADFMAAHFSRHGVAAIALHGNSAPELRSHGPRMLAQGEV
jgi:hypothetical protein